MREKQSNNVFFPLGCGVRASGPKRSQPVTKVWTATNCCRSSPSRNTIWRSSGFQSRRIEAVGYGHKPHHPRREKRVLYEIASSHLARRTFVGNLYKQVKDPNLVGALSGHKEGSKAFARYRTIDDEMKKELVNLLS